MPTNFYIILRNRADYSVKAFNPEWVSSGGISWVYQQQGGLAQIDVELAVPFEQITAAPGDYLEVWKVGESVPRARGIVSIPEIDIDLKENTKLTAYGRMAHMDKVLEYSVFIHPAGSVQDVAIYAGQLFTDYQAYVAAGFTGALPFNLVADIQTIGVNLDQLAMTPATVRSGMDSLYNQCGAQAVWGWDIDPVTGADRFYLRPRVFTVGKQYFVGNNVKLLNAPSELDPVVNSILLRGGNAKYPNILINAGYEQPTPPTSDAGDLLTNGGFETPYKDDDGSTYDSTLTPWVGSGGVSRNMYDPASNHNGSPHTGGWYLLLDSTSKSVYQDAPVSLNQAYICTLFARLENELHDALGTLTIDGIDSDGTVTETPAPTLSIAPQSTAWIGGPSNSVIGGESLMSVVTFTNSSTVKARISIACTETSGAGFGLMIDDVVLAPSGGVGQYGWGTHVQSPGSDSNEIQSIAWASAASAWEGSYGVRAQVIASADHATYLNPAGPDLDPNSQFHFKPDAQTEYNVGFYIRMASGSAGQVRVEWREWASNGGVDNYVQGTNTDIAADGKWHLIYETISTHGDAVTATMQVAFTADGTYDVDGCFVRNSAAALPVNTDDAPHIEDDPISSNYLRGTVFEKFVDVTTDGVASLLSTDAAASIDTWGKRQQLVENPQITDWTSDAEIWAAAYFNQDAILLTRPKVTIIAPEGITLPGDGTQVQISGTMNDPAPQWCSKATYTWRESFLSLDLELSNERPTIAKLLLKYAGLGGSANASSGSSSPTVGAPSAGSGNGGATTPSAIPEFQTDSFSVDGTSYTLTQTPDGNSFTLYGDGIEQPAANYSVSGTTLTIGSGVTIANWATVRAVYTYS